MSTATRTRPAVRKTPTALQWIPKPLARLTVEQYEKMVDSGIFSKRARFHLIDGLLVAKEIKKPPHLIATESVQDELRKLFPTGWHVRVEGPVRLPPRSEPEPDVWMARGHRNDYANRHPGPADLALVVEVADSSLPEVRKMATVYGAAGIPVYWIVNLKARQVEVYTLKRSGGYGKPRIYKANQSVPVVIDGAVVAKIPVAELFPPPTKAKTSSGA